MNHPSVLTAEQRAVELITRLCGNHCGLNADWSVTAWRVSGALYAGIFITDDEDGSFSVVRSRWDAESDCHATESLRTEDALFAVSLVEFALSIK